MKIAFFSTKPYDRQFFERLNCTYRHDLHFFDTRLHADTAILAHGFPAICLFVNDQADAEILDSLAAGSTRLLALRCAGFNNIDVDLLPETEYLINATTVLQMKPKAPIVAYTPDPKVYRRLSLSWGVRPILLNQLNDTLTDVLAHIKRDLVQRNFAAPGDKVLVVGGIPFGQSGGTNFLKVHQIPELSVAILSSI